jgi:hypothetical protein
MTHSNLGMHVSQALTVHSEQSRCRGQHTRSSPDTAQYSILNRSSEAFSARFPPRSERTTAST